MPACALRCTALLPLVITVSWRAAAAPLIDSVHHTPAIPGPADAVEVEARSPGAACGLRWRVDGGSFQTKPMTDTDGDGHVEATLDPQPNGTVIEFFIDAADPSGSASWPAGSTGALWQTDNSLPAGAWTPGAQPLCFAVLREQDRAALTAAGGSTGYSGTFLTVDGTGTSVRYGCTFRSSGGAPPGLTVAFPADSPLQGRAALELNSHFPHSHVLSAAVWRRAGLPAGEAAPVKLRLNGVDHAETGVRMFGSYARAEAPGAVWLTRQYPLDALGNLYLVSDAGPGTHGELAYELPATPANYAETYFPLTNIAGAGYADVIALTNKLSNAAEATYKAEISQVLNLDQWLSFLALDALTGNVKPGLQSGRGTDFYLYRGVNDARFVFIPRAMDTSFGLGENGTGDPVTRSIFSYEGVQGLNRMMNHPDILPDYYAKLLSLTETVFNHTVLDPLADQWLGGWTDAATVQQVKNFITARRANVLAQIPQAYAMTVTTGAPDVEGMRQTTDGSAAASGTFHAGQVRSIRVNGLPATLYYRTAGANAAGTWTCAIPAGNSILPPGVNILKAKFYDGPNGTGSVVKELTATVFRSGGTGTDVSGMLGTGPPQNLFKYGVYSSTPANNVPGSVWKYLTNGTNPGPTWKDEGFNDTSWSSAATQIGYGEAQRDEQTLVARVDYVPGTSGTQSAPTYYFRNTFTIADLNAIASVPGEVKYDDGAVVYVNGTEILRTTNLAPDAGHDSYADFNGAASRENALAPFTIPLTLLHSGVNTIAVEVHQESATSTDLTFDLKLDAVPKPIVTAFQWTRAGSPYHLTGDTIIPAGVTLTIDPGVSVFADAGRRLIVSGIIKALGTADARLRFSNVPGAPLQDDPREPGTQTVPPKWGGILVTDSLSSENIIKYADFVNAQPTAVEGSITVLRSECLVDHCSFRLTYLHGVYGKNCSLTVQDCYFPSVYPPGKESLGEDLDNLSEFVEVDSPPNDSAIENNPAFFEGFPVGGHIRLYRNVFEGATGHNDLVDVTSGKWGLTPVFDVQDNIFLGPTGDEHLDLNGDAYIAGNFFQNCKKDIYTSDHGYANAVSADVTEEETTVVITRNVFTRVDHGVNVKSGVGAIFEHNTMADINQDYHFERGTGQNLFVQDVKTSAINFFIPEDTGPEPGDGAYAAFNLFYGSVPPGEGASGFPRVFSGADMVDEDEPPFTTKIEMAHNFLDPAILDPVIGTSHPDNVYATVWQARTGDPLFVDRAGKNFALQAHSPARGTAPFGLDYGAGIPAGCYLANLPPALTPQAVSAITIGGPGIFAYQWRIDGGQWSATVQIAPGVWSLLNPTVRTAVLTTPALADGLHTLEVIGQDFAGNWQATPASASWTVQANLQRIVISEVLADALAESDTVELHNAGGSAVSLTGWYLTNDSTDPDKFPLSGTLPAGAWMTFTIPGLDLDAAGDDLRLFQGAIEKDAVVFGSQAARLSIGRVGRDGQWTLCTPTPNAANTPARIGPPSSLRLNEWLAVPAIRFSTGWVEIANTGTLPVALTGLTLTNNTSGNPSAFTFPPLSYIDAGGFLKLSADSSAAPGHLPFTLDPAAGSLSLSGPGTVIDFVDFGSQSADTSMGRDAAGALTFYTNPTGGSANILTEPSSFLPWLAWHATAQGSDNDKDGLSAFAEYALGTNPHTAGVIPLQTAGPPAQITVYLPQNAAAPQGHGKPEVSYAVQAADNLDSPFWSTLSTKTPLSSWTNPSAVTVGPPVSGYVPVTVQDSPSVPGKPRRFLRMMMTWTP